MALGAAVRQIGVRGVAVVAVAAMLALVSVALGPGSVAAVAGPAAAPVCDATPSGVAPTQARERYGLDGLHDAGFRGGGIRIAQLQWEATVDQEALDNYSDCMGVPHVHLVPMNVGTSVEYPPSGESMADAEMVAGLAPDIEGLYVFTGPPTGSSLTAASLDPLLEAALTPANTGGALVDIISISYNSCEENYGPTASTEAILSAAAAMGVWILKGAGDSGSSGCAPHGTCDADGAYTGQAVGYPASSWSVVSLGGVTFTGSDPVRSPEVVWNWASQCSGSGGGPSHDFAAPPWQARVPGGLTDRARMVPDVASLAGDPGWETYSPDGSGGWIWKATAGDSLTGPVWAGALAVVRNALEAQGVEPPAHLGPVLYAIAEQMWDPIAQAFTGVFHDVVPRHGWPIDNDVRGVGCCEVLVGYDMTTGLGSADFGELAAALALSALGPAPAPPAPAAPSATPAFTG